MIKPMQLIHTLVQMCTPDPASERVMQQVVYRVKEANGIQNTWQKRIIELADGKSINKIAQILFREEIGAGSWVVDIGLWRNLFDQSVVKTVGELAEQGYVRLEPDNGSPPSGEPVWHQEKATTGGELIRT